MSAARGAAVTAATALALLAAACSGNPAPPSPPTPAPSTVARPAPSQRGPQVVVEGTVRWRTGHLGCAEMVTTAGQHLQLTGALATAHERAALDGGPAIQRMRITGYAPPALETVCGSALAFHPERADPMP